MNETDWKIFNEVKKEALEKFCSESLSAIKEVISDDTNSNHNRFLEIYELIENANNDIAAIFDGHSRSRAALQIMLMRKHCLVSDEQLAKFSVEFQENTRPINYE